MKPTKQTHVPSDWTPGECRDRMATCRQNAPHYRAMPSSSRYSYRVINANLYLQYRAYLRALLGAAYTMKKLNQRQLRAVFWRAHGERGQR